MKMYSVSFTALVMALLWASLSLPDPGNNVNPTTRVGSAAMGKTKPLASLSGSYSGGGYNSYGRHTINLTGYSGSVSLTFYIAAVPNRFTLYDSNGQFLWTSDWVGDADYQGFWGTSLHTTPNTFYRSLTGGASYGLDVETVTDPNAGTRQNDYWSVSY